MNLSREIARTLARMTPGSLLSRLKDDTEFSALADLSGVSYGNLGVVDFDLLTTAISRATASSAPVEITNDVGQRFNLECDVAGVWITPFDASFVRKRYPEFDLLRPQSEARVGSFRSAAANCWPWLPSKIYWEQLLQARLPSERELLRVVADIRITPRHHLSSVENKLKSGVELSLDELLPTALPYYEALVGTPDSDATMEEWIQGKLLPRLAELIDNSLLDGLKCAIAINIDPRLSPTKLLSSVADADLLSSLRALVGSRSPIIVMGVLEIAASRSVSADEFRQVALEAFQRLFDQQRNDVIPDECWKLMAAFAESGLRRLSASEQMCGLPVYWRRIAAFASASALVDHFILDVDEVPRCVQWIADAESMEERNAMLLDAGREPMWTYVSLDPVIFRRSQLRRLVTATSEVDCEIQPELLKELSKLITSLPDAPVSEAEKCAPGPILFV